MIGGLAKLQACPRCRALLEAGTKKCPYCSTQVQKAAVLTAHVPGDLGDAGAAYPRAGRVLIGVFVALYLLMLYFDPNRDAGIQGWTTRPSHVATYAFGTSNVFGIRACGQSWRLVSALFMHLSLLHLAMNSVAVLILAPLVVAVLGLKRAGVLFLLTGLAGAAASHLAGHGGAGASGAVCGAIGALLAFGKREAGLRGAVLMRAMKQWVMILVLWTVVALAANMNIDHIAHWVGFAAGLALGWWGEGGRAGRLSGAPLWNALFYAGAAAVVATAFFVGVQVQRSFHARDVAFYNRGSFQALQRIQLRLHGGGEPLAAKLDLPDPPPGSEELDQALREAWQAVRESPSAAAAVSSFDAAELLWQAWRIESMCRYGPCAAPAS